MRYSILILVLFFVSEALGGNLASQPKRIAAPNTADLLPPEQEQMQSSIDLLEEKKSNPSVIAAWIVGICTVIAALISIIPIMRHKRAMKG